MKSWAQLVADTVRMGGVLVFIKDQAPQDFQQWLQPLAQSFAMKIPITVRNKSDFVNSLYQTGIHDLIFFFEGQQAVLAELDAHVQGQRVWVSAKGDSPATVDYLWTAADVSAWMTFWNTLAPQFDSMIENWSNSQMDHAPCLFLDRDDVVVKNIPYNKDPNQVELIPEVVELIHKAHAEGYWVALVTNQSGIGRGRISWQEYKQVHQRMLKLLANEGAWIDECVWSSYIENESVPEGRLLAGLRKPRAGMFQMVKEKLKIDMKNSIMVGDSATDLIAAHSAGIGSCYLFRSEKLEKEREILEKFRAVNSKFSYQAISAAADISFGRL
ncbi:D-glycero-alpha-D-manno-heptose-1,7-bisphosphate 7-phosphatase [Bdellovibrio sp. HCB185ZH]|uniref:D-glycero-alpha-D-manno-heptose-1,7-bisphosphate 7-phosphatase n=1 Tax=Bdellovibrio sp. HCB185ZH TaxID=3394235 RepID=UPI0039A67948